MSEKRYLIRTSRDKSWIYEVVAVIISDDGHTRIGEVIGHANRMDEAEKIQDKAYEDNRSS